MFSTCVEVILNYLKIQRFRNYVLYMRRGDSIKYGDACIVVKMFSMCIEVILKKHCDNILFVYVLYVRRGDSIGGSRITSPTQCSLGM